MLDTDNEKLVSVKEGILGNIIDFHTNRWKKVTIEQIRFYGKTHNIPPEMSINDLSYLTYCNYCDKCEESSNDTYSKISKEHNIVVFGYYGYDY